MQSFSIGLILWLALTAVINTIFHYATPADVDAWAERNPFVAKVAAMFRRGGFEPIALLNVVAKFFSSDPPPPGALGRLSGPLPKMSTPPLPLLLLVLVIGLQISALAVACAGVLPSAADQKKFGSYSEALAACDAKLKIDKETALADGGTADRSALLASYKACADDVDVKFGRADGGAK